MKRIRRCGGLVAALMLACAGPSPAPSPAPAGSPPAPVPPARFDLPGPEARATHPSHVLLVSVAGLAPDAHRASSARAPVMPTLARLAAAGAAADAVAPIAPASPGPAHATLASGRRPADHGIGGDHPLLARGTDPARHREAERIGVPTLWTRAHEAGVPTALLGWPTTSGAKVQWLLPELLPARLGESSSTLLEGRATPSLLVAAERLGASRPETGVPSAARDAMLAGLACEVLAGPVPPRLTLLRFSETELVLRRAGPGSAEADAAFARIDAQLARVLGCLAEAGRLAATAVVVSGDVAVAPIHTLVRPNAALAEAGLLVPSARARGEVERWDAYARSNGRSAFVYARDPESAVLARRALDEAAAITRAFRVVSAQQMLALGADRGAWFGLEAEPGHAFSEGLADELVGPSPLRGAWGGLDPSPSEGIGFVAWGSGVRGPLRIPVLRQTDVAPTVARLLGLALPGSDGRALVGVVRAPPVAAGAR